MGIFGGGETSTQIYTRPWWKEHAAWPTKTKVDHGTYSLVCWSCPFSVGSKTPGYLCITQMSNLYPGITPLKDIAIALHLRNTLVVLSLGPCRKGAAFPTSLMDNAIILQHLISQKRNSAWALQYKDNNIWK